MSNLPVPYKSQWDSDAGKTNNDCGPCDIAMILNFYESAQHTTNEVFTKTGAGGGLISWVQLQKAITAFGYTSHLERNSTLDRVKALIDNKTPPILLVHYGSFKSTQDKKFKGGHFFLPVGYNNDGLFVNDSDFQAPIRLQGDHHNYLNDELLQAWKDCSIDKNQPFSLLWIERKNVIINPDMSQPWVRQMFLEVGVDIDKPESDSRQRVQEIVDGYKKYPDLQAQVNDLNKKVAFEIGEAAKFEQESQQYAKAVKDLQTQVDDLNHSLVLRESDISKLQEQVASLQSQLDPDKVVVINKDEYIKLTSTNGLDAYTPGDLFGAFVKKLFNRKGV